MQKICLAFFLMGSVEFSIYAQPTIRFYYTGNYDSGIQSIAGMGSTLAGPNNPVPSLSILSPSRMLVGSPAIDLTVQGVNFAVGATVRWNNQNRSTTFLSSAQLRVAIPAADLSTAGMTTVTVLNPAPGGGISNPLSFDIANPTPSLCCTNPISVDAGSSDFLLTLYGSNFVDSSVVHWNGKSVPVDQASLTSTKLKALITAKDVKDAWGQMLADVTVTNPSPGGGISKIQTIVINPFACCPPIISSISPDSLLVGDRDFTLTVKGDGFIPESIVQFNGKNRLTTFVSEMELTARILAADITTASTNAITVYNPFDSTSGSEDQSRLGSGLHAVSSYVTTATFIVLNPVPLVFGINPPSATLGSAGFSVAVQGTSFVPASSFRWNGADRSSTFVDSSQLRGAILTGDLALKGTGTASLTVSNPGPGGGISNSLAFTIRTGNPSSAALYYPRLVSTDSESTGIAVANLSGMDATLTLWAFDRSGSEVKGPEINNPVSISIAGFEQLPILDRQLYGPGLSVKSPVGWIKVESTVSKVLGFFLSFNDTLTIMDGANVSAGTLNSFIFPEIEDQGFTQIHVANPNTAAADLSFELYKSNGSLRKDGVVRRVNPNGALAEFFSDLFPDISPEGSDYIRTRSTRGVVPFEYLGKTGQYVEGLNGQDDGAGAATLYSPQYVVGAGYQTVLSIVNLESAGGTVTLEFIGDDGTLLGVPKAVPVVGKGKVRITDQKFFLDPGNSVVQGYLKITSSGPKLTGSVVFGDPGRKMFSSSLPLVSALLSSFYFGHVASNSTYFTGVAILNPNAMEVFATIEVLDRNGKPVRTKVESIGGKRRVSKLMTQYFADLGEQEISSGYIRVTADKGVASFALFGTHDLSVLSAIPAQPAP